MKYAIGEILEYSDEYQTIDIKILEYVEDKYKIKVVGLPSRSSLSGMTFTIGDDHFRKKFNRNGANN